MSWITIVWSVNAGICLALAGMQLLVWAKSQDAWANLLFFKAGVGGQGMYVSPSADTVVVWFSTGKQAEEVLARAIVKSLK